ncbi:MAG: hypothetical protein ABIP54_02100 [Candidatus Andersenbacteria bacterium]
MAEDLKSCRKCGSFPGIALTNTATGKKYVAQCLNHKCRYRAAVCTNKQASTGSWNLMNELDIGDAPLKLLKQEIVTTLVAKLSKTEPLLNEMLFGEIAGKKASVHHVDYQGIWYQMISVESKND